MRWARVVSLVLFVCFGSGLLFSASSVQASSPEADDVVIPGAGMPIMVSGNIYEETSKKVDNFFKTLVMGGMTALMNASQTFAQRLAHDAATAILTASSGQKPVFHEDGPLAYFKSVGEQVGNQALSDLNDNFTKAYGFDLCSPVDPLKLSLGLSLPLGEGPAELKPNCTAAGIVSAWEQTKASFSSTKDVSDLISAQFDPNSSDLGVSLGVQNKLIGIKLDAKEAAKQERLEGGGVKAITDLISGKIKTPAATIKAEMESEDFRCPDCKTRDQYVTAFYNNAFELGFTQLGMMTASTFVNTLASGWMKQLFDGLKPSSPTDLINVDLVNSQAVVNRNLAAARIVFSDLLTPNLMSTDKQDFVIELSSCPTPRGMWGCAMDDALATALRTSNENGAYTVSQAAQMTANGEPPSNPAFLHAEWELIPEVEAKDNTDPTCYQRAYCASNLAKMRFARIIPVGWEMAANSPYNQKKNGKYITLGEVIRGFSNCNTSGEADGSHPWCKLIDPNWVLTAPPFQCRIKGYGDTVFGGTSLRLQECSDVASCLTRDDKGNCTGGYGYCLAEKPVWRFSADACLERFASCRTYSTRSGQQVSYLRNSIDYGSCSADNVGCLWYASLRNSDDISGRAWETSSKVYFDATVKTCPAGADGCTKLLFVQQNQSSLNLVPNGSFEQGATENDPNALSMWTVPSGAGELNSDIANHGVRSMSLLGAPGNVRSPAIVMYPSRSYTYTLTARAQVTSTQAGFAAWLTLYTAEGSPVTPANVYRSSGCDPVGSSSVGFDQAIPAGSDGTWKTYTCVFTSNIDVASSTLEMNGDNILVDAIQLEEGERPTAFIDGEAVGLKETHLRMPPDELNCTGNETSDNPLCKNYARMCRQTDAGCQAYQDVNNASAPRIPATLSALDYCPNSCVGYAEYLKQPSTFDLVHNVAPMLDDPEDKTSVTFIPSTANQCTIQDVGCEEFTNVQASAEGGESKAYYNYIGLCEKPSDASETFFTWEGSDTTGYQLHTWSLIHDASMTPNPPKIIQRVGPDRRLKDPANCNDVSWNAGTDPDCRQMYNGNGDVFYVFMSQTIASSPLCTDYRLNATDVADCEKTGGSFTPATGECIYHVLPSGSNSCNAARVGCRAYLGATGRNTTVAFEENFNASGTVVFEFGPNTSGARSNEAILVGDQSLKVTGQGALLTQTEVPLSQNQIYRISFWAKAAAPAQSSSDVQVAGNTVGDFRLTSDWRRYDFGPFTVPVSSASTTVAWRNLPNPAYIDQIRIDRVSDITFVVKDTWKTPAQCDQTSEGVPQPQAMLNCRAYTDPDGNAFAIRQFAHLCQENAIGCTAFVDTRNTQTAYAEVTTVAGTPTTTKVTVAAKQWDEKYIGDWEAKRPADRFVYAINDASKRCDAAQDSCRAFGKPNLAPSTLDAGFVQLTGDDAKALGGPSATSVMIGDFQTVYLLDDASQYVDSGGEPSMLCRKSELFCNEFKSGKTVAYFRDPMQHACEWRDKVQLKADPANQVLTDGAYSGWFRTGTDAPCYPELLSSGDTYLLQNSGDPTYQGWVGMCPLEQSECTEFRDPNDHSDPVHPTGKPYFFIKNQRLDVTSCNGSVDLLKGCVLFRDMTDSRDRFATAASYAKYHEKGDTAQAPIDCVNDPENPQCVANKTCHNTKLETCTGRGCVEPKVAFPYCMYANCNTNDFECLQVKKFGGCTGVDTLKNVTGASCQTDADCVVERNKVEDTYRVVGTCGAQNDANVLMKVKLDRDCSEWLGCSTAESVYDPAQQKYVEICTELAMCDVSKGVSGGSFCANYIDRSKEPVLQPGVFFDRSVYTKRPIGFGLPDYTGYAIPDQFQAVDLQNRLVGKELFANDQATANKFATDYRLVAGVAETTGLIEFPANVNVPVNPLYPTLNICKHLQTGRTGYFIKGELAGKRVCYFAISSLATRSPNVAFLGPDQTSDPRNIEPVSDMMRQSLDPLNDATLQQAFPPAECKAYPESTSPFPNLYVKDWDLTRLPITPEKIVDGYGSVTLCEYGEQCACSYRRVKYGNGQLEKYYSPFGVSPIAGICNGGKKDGQACIPGATTAATQSGETTQATTEDVGCEGGGRCMAISDVILVRGQSGQCLERDNARSVANDNGRHPCLVWNPSPILAGQQDVTHFNPTAGYMPPVNAGEYYCLSKGEAPIESVWSAMSHTSLGDSRARTPDEGGNPYFYLPGVLSKFNYDQGYVGGFCHNADECGALIEGRCNCHDGSGEGGNATALDIDASEYMSQYANFAQECDNPVIEAFFPELAKAEVRVWNCMDRYRFTNLGMGIDGVKPWTGGEAESPQAVRCMLAMSDPDPDVKSGILPFDRAPWADENRGRWIMTGRGGSRTYMEYFVPVKPAGVAGWLSPGSAVSEETKKEAMFERNFSQFQFFPVNDQYAAACSLPPEYVEGVSVDDWSDLAQVGAASNQVFTALNRDFDGMLDRSKEKILVNKDGKPIKETCSGLNDGADPGYGDEGRCYMKYWETDYRMEGTSKFEWLDEESGQSLWTRHNRFYSHERTCQKSGFAIRAMFELAEPLQNKIPETLVSEGQLTGPWKFVGFWVTACKSGDNWESSLFLSLRVKHADVCTDIGQVISPYSRESASFADRVWAGGGFAIPQLGFSFSAQYAPFGSALATGLPGKEPLFQTSGPVENWSALKPPTFIGAGASYVSNSDAPAFRWGHLTNIFARVYRVYHYSDTAVTRTSWACIGGTSPGKWCPNPPSTDPNSQEYKDWQEKSEQICGSKGDCDNGLTSDAKKNALHLCNGLSGVNAGLECGSTQALPSLDPVCHNAPMRKMENGSYQPQYVACKERAGWSICPVSGLWNHPQYGSCANFGVSAKLAHEQYNAFGCDGAAVLQGAGCAKPESNSVDCPLRIDAGTIACDNDSDGPMRGHCRYYDHARCNDTNDCVFTVYQWWGAYDDGIPKTPDQLNTTQYLGQFQEDSFANHPEHVVRADVETAAASVDPPTPYLGTGSLMTYVYPPDGGQRYPTFLPQVVDANGGTSFGWNANPPPQMADPTQPGWPIVIAGVNKLPRLKSYNYYWPWPHAVYSRHGSFALVNQDSLAAKRYPAAHPAVDTGQGPGLAAVQPGLCEGAQGALMDPNNTLTQIAGQNSRFSSHMRPQYAFQIGLCDGGAFDGQTCYSSSAGYKKVSGNNLDWDNTPSCWMPQIQGGDGSGCQPVATIGFDGKQNPRDPECLLSSGDAYSEDPDKDNNSCTHSSGYSPRIDVCGDQSNEKCLTGYDLAGNTKQKSLDYQTPQPTDVTSGFHKPSYLGVFGPDTAKETYIAFYAPRPPTVAAPDFSHACAAPGQCKITQTGAFTLESQSSGSIFYSGGKAQVSMKFYGWADHEQSPLKALTIDWGDGSRTTIDNARMKNKKPFCGGMGECELIPGLTCQSDSDCPAAGGKCGQRGTCTQNPSKTCFRNADCQAGGNTKDTCSSRLFFGNSDDACEANYFEFSHAYTCNPKDMPSCKLQDGTEITRCSSNPDLECDVGVPDTCPPGDSCVGGLAPSGSVGSIGGCYDPDKVACRFTPKLMLKDNWNWCTGDCRQGPVVGNQPTDIIDAIPGYNRSAVRHVYGGCWDGTETKLNTKISDPGFVMGSLTNECRTDAITVSELSSLSSPNMRERRAIRPWVVYQGAVEIGIFQ